MTKATARKQEVTPKEVPVPEVTPPEVKPTPAVKAAPKQAEKLTIGTIVHYVIPNGDHLPAIVISGQLIGNGRAHLQVFGIMGNDNKVNVEYSKEPTPNTWHWIER